MGTSALEVLVLCVCETVSLNERIFYGLTGFKVSYLLYFVLFYTASEKFSRNSRTFILKIILRIVFSNFFIFKLKISV